jgi:hypothetical protein
MNKKMTSLILMAALVVPGMGCWADDTNATGNNNSPLAHPVNAYTNHEVKEDIKDSQVNSQKAAESKAAFKQAKADYEKSLKDNGADSQVTKDAKNRMHDAHKEMRKYNKKTAKANKDLKADETKAQP